MDIQLLCVWVLEIRPNARPFSQLRQNKKIALYFSVVLMMHMPIHTTCKIFIDFWFVKFNLIYVTYTFRGIYYNRFILHSLYC
jgi:hypothetical protein